MFIHVLFYLVEFGEEKPMKYAADQYREYAYKHYVEPARRNGEKTVRIKSGDIVNGLKLKNQTPNVCNALEGGKFQERYRLKLIDKQTPAPKGTSTTVVFTYRILDASGGGTPARRVTFADLEGIGKETFKALGGGEAFIRNERENFYGNNTPDPGKRG